MADRYLIETSVVDGFLLEDSSGVLLLEQQAGTGPRARLPLTGVGNTIAPSNGVEVWVMAFVCAGIVIVRRLRS